MASITQQRNGRRTIQFIAGDGKRRSLRLGKCSQRDAEWIGRHVDALAAAAMHAQPISRETALWVASLGDKLHRRLAAVGLVPSRAAVERPYLGAFLDGYLAQRQDVKAGTMLVLQQAKRWLVRFLGDDKLLVNVTPGDADAYRSFLLGNDRAVATVNKWCGYARHFFEVAKRRRLIADNPFGHLKVRVRGNLAKRVFVSAVDVVKVINMAPDPQWKLLIALARWGGLRIPSEALALKWGDVDFEHNRFTVRASKTESHQGGGIRLVPMFPELAGHFQAVFADAPEGSEHVITRYRNPAANLRTQFVRYILAAGLVPWPKPWQNLRSTRATELADKFPSHVCAAWLGHTEAVADEFYRQVTEEHFQRALALESAPEKAVQKAVQQLSGLTGSNAQGTTEPVGHDAENPGKSSTMRDVVPACASVRDRVLGAVGFEPT